jgi:hypothetical protein
MDYKLILKNLLKDNEKKSNYLVIYLGEHLDDIVFNKNINNIDQVLVKYKLDNPKFKNIKYKAYNHYNLKLEISNKLSCTKNVFVDSTDVSLNDIDMHITFWNIHQLDSSEFSCQKEYHYVKEDNRVLFSFNNNINVIFEDKSIYLKHKIQPNSLKFLDQISFYISDLVKIINLYNSNET